MLAAIALGVPAQLLSQRIRIHAPAFFLAAAALAALALAARLGAKQGWLPPAQAR